MTLLQRLLAGGYSADSCLVYPGHTCRNGYARVAWRGRVAQGHRAAWELVHGEPPPAHLDLHHTCANRRCVNPLHLAPLPHRDNCLSSGRAKATHCTNGHAYADAGYLVRGRHGRETRRCRTCDRRAWRDYGRRQKLKHSGPPQAPSPTG